MTTLKMKTRVGGTIAPPASLLPGEIALRVGVGSAAMWIGDQNGNPHPYGTDPAGFVRRTGDQMTGPLILQLDAPTQGAQAANKAYVDAQIQTRYTQGQGDARYLRLTGGTLTGQLTLAAKPAQALHAASKNYVDDLLANYRTATQDDARFLQLAGGTMTGPLTLPSAAPTSADHATRKGYVDDQVGGRLTQGQGDIRYARVTHNHSEAQITDLDRMRWRGDWVAGSYAQNDVVAYQGAVYVAGGNTTAVPPAGNWRALGRSGAGVSAQDTPPASPGPGDLWFRTSEPAGLFVWYVDATSSQWVATDQASVLAEGFVAKTGSAMSGQLQLMAGDPTAPSHAVRKAYVDAQIAALAARIAALEGA